MRSPGVSGQVMRAQPRLDKRLRMLGDLHFTTVPVVSWSEAGERPEHIP